MAKRQIRDEHGATWDVWDVIPKEALWRVAYDRRNPVRRDVAPSDERAPMLHAELEAGWLCFQGRDERRRFAPIPAGWFELPEAVLSVMLGVARPVSLPTDPSFRPTPAE